MPISRITELVALEACARWLTSAETPTDPSTAERASSTGRPAATKAPNANSRIRNVSGTESFSAWEKSLIRRRGECLVGARLAELLDAEAGMRPLQRGHRREHRSDV